MKKKIIFIGSMLLIALSVKLLMKISNAYVDVDAIEKLTNDLNHRKQTFDQFIFPYQLMQFKPYKARFFRSLSRSKSIDESIYIDKKGKFLSVAGKVKRLSDYECSDLYVLMNNLSLETMIIYEGNCAKLTTTTINYNLKAYSYYYTDNWGNELPSLLSQYSILKNESELDVHEKWILVVDEHWGIMN